ncbi:hypothetical protein Tco_0822824 [Tanacetum coccineum]|uniref:Reverse transcriptase domain-containing protein n=1 Tax=Tanacetum coccineum TaxID=301880 RepID=A0ABQ5AG56_9ASTR
MLMDNKETFDRLRSINMKLNLKMCSFGAEEGPFLGHLITKQGIKANPLKVKAITNLKPPRTLKEVLTIKPIKKILARPEKSGQIAKLVIELGEHDIKFKGCNSVTRKILAYFLAKTPSTEYKDTETKKPEEANKVLNLKSTWKLYIEGASSSDGSGASLMLVSHEGKEYTYALRLPAGGKPGPTQAKNIIREIHDGSCGINAEPRSIIVKVTKQGYYRPSMYRDAAEAIQDRTRCQTYSTAARMPNNDVTTVNNAWSFSHWGINIVRLLPTAPRSLKFLVIAIKHFTKWVEAKPLTKANGRHA